MKKWKVANISLSINYILDSYSTYHNLHLTNRYVNAIELLHRSLIYYVYSKFKQHEIKSKTNGWYENLSDIISKNSELKSKDFIYKLNDFRNEIVHRLGHKDYKIDSYGHNFFVNAMAEMKELIINDYSHFSSRLSDLELNLQTKFFDDLKENEMTNLIKQVYGDGFYETKVKVRFVTIKTDVNEDLIIRVAKSLSGKTKSEREELLKHGFTIVLDPNPKAIEEKFRHTPSSIWEKWKELGFGQQKILYKTIKNTRTIETKDKEWWEKTKNSFCYTDEFVRKIDPKLLDE